LENSPWNGDGSVVTVDGRAFHVGPSSFWQSHRDAPDALVASVRQHANAVSAKHVVDLYGGVGLFGLTLAKSGVPRVTIVEQSSAACADARINGADMDELTIKNSGVSTHTVTDAVGRGDLVILDPPRTGTNKGVIAALGRARPRRVLYVSCDAATMSRDIGAFRREDYRLVDLDAFDLFPMTEHLELVGVLDDAGTRRQSGERVRPERTP
jgi:tRNA/tmRNA/rRNA uracil-C5-methylase (TrmA/RlmC/RlmD family)